MVSLPSLSSLAPEPCLELAEAPLETLPPTNVRWWVWRFKGRRRGALWSSQARELLRQGMAWASLPWQSVCTVPASTTALEALHGLSAPLVAVTGPGGDLQGIVTVERLAAHLCVAYAHLRAQHEATLEAVNDAITIVDAEKRVLGWNWAAEKMFGFRAQDILGQPHAGFFDPSRQWCIRVLDTGERAHQLPHVPKDGVYVIINSRPIMLDGRIIGAVSAEQDVTQFVSLQSALLEATARRTYLEREMGRLQNDDDPYRRIVGRSRSRNELVERARKVAATAATVLVRGESGTGKELVAMALHEASDRAGKPFVVVNSGGIPSALFESVLFGYESGAFTGADRRGKPGLIEAAEGGTLFLDEVGDLPQELQVKMLRVLEDRSYYRVGAARSRVADVRFIAATNRRLEEMIGKGTFREDLFYRLGVITIHVPPLRDRKEDLPDLIHLFLHEFSVRYRRPVSLIEPGVMHALLRHHWPGNIRELRNAIEQEVVLADDGVLRFENLPQELRHRATEPPTGVGMAPPAGHGGAAAERLVTPGGPAGITPVVSLPRLDHSMLEAERRAVHEALDACHGNKAEAARLLGVSRPTLYAILRRLGRITAEESAPPTEHRKAP